ncbi:MAG: hypothetical protein M3395_00190 [Chloroflexota bacterium]|nr:hypothetical protein [Chloroflexota bacterium]
MNPILATERAWFAPMPASRLAVMRIVVGAYTLGYLGQRVRMLARMARSDPRLFAPVGVARPLRRPLPPKAVDALTTATLVSGACFTAGGLHRVSGPVFAGSLVALLSYRNSWSMIFHSDNALVLHAVILGLAPSADALSVDALARDGGAGRRPDLSWHYGWPIRLMNTLTVTTYALAAVAKLKGPLGRRWTTGESLRRQIGVDGMRKELLGDGAAPMSVRLWNQVLLFRLLAVGSMLIEAGAPLALVHRRLGQIWAINAFLMHWGIYLLMGIKFRYQQSGLIFAPFFDLEQLPAALIRR